MKRAFCNSNTESSPTPTVAPPGPTAGDVERANRLMNRAPSASTWYVVGSLIDARRCAAEEIASARAELLAHIIKWHETQYVWLRDNVANGSLNGAHMATHSESVDYLRALYDKLTEAKPRASEFATKVAASGLGDA